MDAEQLQQLATNAELNHWPPHLGVTTDAEKVAYLAERLREAADAETRADELADQLETANEDNSAIELENKDLLADIETLKADVRRLENKLEAVREIVE